MNDQQQMKYFKDIISIGIDHDLTEEVIWVVCDNGDYVALVVCNDFFIWGSSELVKIELGDIKDLRKACDDCEEADECTSHYGPLLFSARKEGMRPQGAFYEYIPKSLHYLFDECGPLRNTHIGNPNNQKGHISKTKFSILARIYRKIFK